MSEVTAVPLRPISKGALTALWIGVAALVAVGVGVAYAGTESQVAMATPPAEYLAANAGRDGVKTTPSGLQYKVLKTGAGPTATAQDMAVVNYEGKLASGEVFDATGREGAGPATLPVGGMIPGWTEALQLMNRGAKMRLWIPPELAYGPTGARDPRSGKYVIPPDALLIFDVELVDIQQRPGGMGGLSLGQPGGISGAPHGM